VAIIKKFIVIKTILCALILLLPSCVGQEKKDYYPLVDGSRWEYEGEMLNDGKLSKVKISSFIDEQETIHGEKFHKIVSVFDFTSEPQINYVRKTQDGIYLVAEEYKAKTEILSVPLPLELGNTWTVNSPEEKGEYSILSRETVYLFDKQYAHCFKIIFKGTVRGFETERTQYFAPNVGLVKQIISGKKFKLKAHLVKYTTGNK